MDPGIVATKGIHHNPQGPRDRNLTLGCSLVTYAGPLNGGGGVFNICRQGFVRRILKSAVSGITSRSE